MDNWLANGIQHTKELSIRTLTANYAKETVPFNLTVGDWDTRYFTFPEFLKEAIARYYAAGATDYADVAGEPNLRQVIAALWHQYTALPYQAQNVIVTSGTRPLLYLACRTILEANDWVLCSTPNWNTRYYLNNLTKHIITIKTKAANGFLLDLECVQRYQKRINLLWLNLPLNPSGHCYHPAQWEKLLSLLEQINQTRTLVGQKPLFVIIDAIYHRLSDVTSLLWQQLAKHPKLCNYLLLVDGIAKCYVATGVRVGWAIGPIFWINAMVKYNSYLGSWAAKPEQLALAEYLQNENSAPYLAELKKQLKLRAQLWQDAINWLRTVKHYPVDALSYQGGLYIVIHLPLAGFNYIPKNQSQPITIDSADQLFHFLIQTAGIAIVSFKYLAQPQQQWWFRVALGRGSVEQYQLAANTLKIAICQLHKAPA